VLLAALPPTANNQQLALASYQALPVGRVQTAGERRGAIGGSDRVRRGDDLKGGYELAELVVLSEPHTQLQGYSAC
jgi:hypothetical protein